MGLKLLEALGIGGVAIAEEVVRTKAYNSFTKYLASPKNIPVKTNLPMVRKTADVTTKQTTADKIQDIITLDGAINDARNSLFTVSRKGVKDYALDLVKKSTDLEVINTKAFKDYVDAPLVSTQYELKRAMESVAEAIHTQTLTSISLLGSLDSNLINIGDGLMAINRSLVDFAPSLGLASELASMKAELEFTPITLTDFEGNAMTDSLGKQIAPMSPNDLKIVKDAAIARYRTDQNNDEYDDDDIPSIDLFKLPIMPFVGRSMIFNPLLDLSSSDNPFMPLSMGV